MMKQLTADQKRLVSDNLKLTGWYMKRVPKNLYRHDKDNFEQELNMGLIEAALTYDKTKGGFATHAIWHFRSRISMWCRRKKRHSKLCFTYKLSHVAEKGQSDRELDILRELLEKLPFEIKCRIPRCEYFYSGVTAEPLPKYERQKEIIKIRDYLAKQLIKEGV